MDKQTADIDSKASTWQNIVSTLIGTVLGLASFFTILALMLMNLPEATPPVAEGQLPPVEQLRQLKAEDQRQLTTYELIDREKGTWRIPIDVAMEKMLTE
jgi:hypothetical protein